MGVGDSLIFQGKGTPCIPANFKNPLSPSLRAAPVPVISRFLYQQPNIRTMYYVQCSLPKAWIVCTVGQVQDACHLSSCCCLHLQNILACGRLFAKLFSHALVYLAKEWIHSFGIFILRTVASL